MSETLYTPEELEIIWEGLKNRERPLTRISTDFPKELVDEFVAKCKETKDKAVIDSVRDFCYGKVAHKRCNWTKKFKAMACEHFGLESFEAAFTEDGLNGQLVAKEMHRARARRTRIHGWAGKAVRMIANDAYQLKKKCDLHRAELKIGKDGTISVAIMAHIRGKDVLHRVTVGKNGVIHEKPLQESPQN